MALTDQCAQRTQSILERSLFYLCMGCQLAASWLRVGCELPVLSSQRARRAQNKVRKRYIRTGICSPSSMFYYPARSSMFQGLISSIKSHKSHPQSTTNAALLDEQNRYFGTVCQHTAQRNTVRNVPLQENVVRFSYVRYPYSPIKACFYSVLSGFR
jgi:hypothetical protein